MFYRIPLVLTICCLGALASDPFAGQFRTKQPPVTKSGDFEDREANAGRVQGTSRAVSEGENCEGEDRINRVRKAKGGGNIPLAEDDAVLSYAKGFVSKIMIATASAVSASVIFTLLVKAIISKSSLFVAIIFATGCSISCFMPGSFGDFSRALGVFTLLLLKRVTPWKFTKSMARQLQSTVLLSARHAFPPVDNPWRFKEPIDSSGEHLIFRWPYLNANAIPLGA